VPLGEEIGIQFNRLPPLQAYSWDLGGSLCGTISFGFFSLFHFSPLLGLALVAVLGLALSTSKQRLAGAVFYCVALGAVVFSGQRGYWSPYYFITVSENFLQVDPATGQPSVVEHPAGDPPPNLRTMQDPPLYTVRVNQDFYQMHGTLDVRRYSEASGQQRGINYEFAKCALPYELAGNLDRVLVLGGGGGIDVETALLKGAQRVDVVEIDPLLPRLSNRYNAAAPYTNPRVVLHIDDARAFLQKSSGEYDVVIFGWLDSQALFSYGASLRLDGYTYTVESFRRAFEHVREGGAMSVSFYVGQQWMGQKLVQMIETATGTTPYVYTREADMFVIVAVKGQPADVPREFFGWRLTPVEKQPVDLATDDWPYLYLARRTVPRDYTIVMGLLLAVSLVSVLAIRGASFGASDGHFLFLGWGFLLLQTKSIGDCSLYFGTTWFVTTLVITGVLLMVLLANWVAIRFISAFRPWLYVPLFATLLVLLLVPRELILAQPLGIRLLWTLIAVPLPIFFAGLIFSTTFREGGNPSALFGANLIGATIGGFCEYLGMWLGSGALSWIVIAAYAASLTCLSISRRRRAPAISVAAAL
jgi:spermidine synthase